VSKKSYKLKKRFYVIMIIALVAVIGFIFQEKIKNGITFIAEIGKEKRVELFNPEEVKESAYFLFTKDNSYAVYADKMSIRFSKNIRFNKEKKLEEMLNAENYREIINYYNFNVPEKISTYYLAEKVTEDFDSASIKSPTIDVNGEKYIDSKILSDIFIYRYYRINYKESESDYKIYADIINATEKDRYNQETVKKLKKLGYSCREVNYGEVLNHSIVVNNKATIEEVKNFILTVNEKYIKIDNEPSFATTADIVFTAGSEKDSGYIFEIYGKKRDELLRTLTALEYFEIKKGDKSKDDKESLIRCNEKDYYTAYKISKIAKIEKIEIDEIEENRIEIIIN
jgi:hypothetical protein